MPVMTGVQIHIRHILCTLLAPDPLASFTQFCGDPVRPVCASAFFKLFFDSLFQMRFPILKSFPITEPGIISCSLYLQDFGPLRHRAFGMALYKSISYFWWLAK